MSTESEFLHRWHREEPIYAAWGRFVGASLSDALRDRIAPVRLELFLKLPVVPRVKEADSMVQKAFYRGKNYANPYDDIEDKVGLRFVVLLTEEIREIESALKTSPHWEASLARDFELEKENRPYEFDYQSLHYVVRSTVPMTFEGVDIPADLPCEVQIRTLLQHAYSELTHDTIYKPNIRATPAIKRSAAKSMALIEATSDYFSSVNKTIQEVLADTRAVADFFASTYAAVFEAPAIDTPLNSLLIDHYRAMLNKPFESDFRSWWERKSFLREAIGARRDTNALYRTPSILLVYFCVSASPTMAKHSSPLTDKELQPIYSDLGLALNGA